MMGLVIKASYTRKLSCKLVAAKEEIMVPSVAMSRPMDWARLVSTGAVIVPAYRMVPVLTSPMTMFFNRLPLVIATTMATRKVTDPRRAESGFREARLP